MAGWSQTLYRWSCGLRKGRIRNFFTGMACTRIGRAKFTGDTVLPESPDAYQAELGQTGIVIWPELLGADVLQPLLRFAAQTPVYDREHPDKGTFSYQQASKHSRWAMYRLQAVAGCQPIVRLANDPGLLSLVQSGLGAKPTIISLNLTWSYPNHEDTDQPPVYQRDRRDLKVMKLVVCLTEVDETAGPLVYVKQSPTAGKLEHKRSVTNEEVLQQYGEDNRLVLLAPKGSAMLMDAYGLSAEQLPAGKNRLLLEVEYALNPVDGSPVEPVGVTWDASSLHPHVNRLVIQTQTTRRKGAA